MAELAEKDSIREVVRERYAEAARSVDEGRASCCGPSESSCGCGTDVPDACGESDATGAEQAAGFGPELYSLDERAELPDEAKLASLGCGNPTAVAELHAGEVVLDLGSGGGIDVLLSAQRVGQTGRAYGLDMTDEMLALARANAEKAGANNVEFLKGTIEEVPLTDDSVDVIISNCVINLSGDKSAVFREAARVLRPGGRFAVTDIVADPDMDEATRRDMAQWTGCIAGALTEDEFRSGLEQAGFMDVELRETHRVHDQAGSAIVRARLRAATSA
jgi:arsenite methyltransferase